MTNVSGLLNIVKSLCMICLLINVVNLMYFAHFLLLNVTSANLLLHHFSSFTFPPPLLRNGEIEKQNLIR